MSSKEGNRNGGFGTDDKKTVTVSAAMIGAPVASNHTTTTGAFSKSANDSKKA